MKAINIRNPLSIIALFCTITEGLCVYALPKLTTQNQNIFIWFVIGFPVMLLVLFFYTLIFHHIKLYSPSDFETKDNNFAELFYDKSFSRKEALVNEVGQLAISASFVPFEKSGIESEIDAKSVDLANNMFLKLDAKLPKHKLSRVLYKKFNSFCYLVDVEIKDENLVSGKEKIQAFVVMVWEIDGKNLPIIVGSGVEDNGSGESIINHILITLMSSTK